MEATEYEFRIFAENETGLSRPRRTPMGIKTKLSGKLLQGLNPIEHNSMAMVQFGISLKHTVSTLVESKACNQWIHSEQQSTFHSQFYDVTWLLQKTH